MPFSKLHQRSFADIMNQPFDLNKDYDAMAKEFRNPLPEYGNGINKEEWEEAREFLASQMKTHDERTKELRRSKGLVTLTERALLESMAMNALLKSQVEQMGGKPDEKCDTLESAIQRKLRDAHEINDVTHLNKLVVEMADQTTEELKHDCEKSAQERKRELGGPSPFAKMFAKREAKNKTFGVDVCGSCGAQESEGGAALLQCAECKGQKHCSKECQRKHWKVHKRGCNAAA